MEIEDKLLELGFESTSDIELELRLEKVDLIYYTSIKEMVVYNKDDTQHDDFETTDEDTMFNWIELFNPKVDLTLKGKVQTNDYGTNVIVETEISSNTHHSHLNKSVIITQILTDEEVIKEGRKAMNELDPAELIKIYKGLLKVKDGFGTSNCSTPNGSTGLTHEYNDIMKFKLE